MPHPPKVFPRPRSPDVTCSLIIDGPRPDIGTFRVALFQATPEPGLPVAPLKPQSTSSKTAGTVDRGGFSDVRDAGFRLWSDMIRAWCGARGRRGLRFLGHASILWRAKLLAPTGGLELACRRSTVGEEFSFGRAESQDAAYRLGRAADASAATAGREGRVTATGRRANGRPPEPRP
jgi:hypothetical protein